MPVNALQALKDSTARAAYGMTRDEAVSKGICIRCKKTPTFLSDAGRREYQISGLCDPCWSIVTCPEEE